MRFASITTGVDLVMLKLVPVCVAVAVIAIALPNAGATVKATVDTCATGNAPAMLVRVIGLKDRSGRVRIRTFGGDPSTYFDKTKALQRLEIPTPASGPIDICMRVPAPGVYAVDVRHDVNSNGKSDTKDGAGASGNPKMSLFDMIFKRKPSPSVVAVRVGNGVVAVPVVMKYVQGGSLKPIGQ
jgi:uncharacterized protein (DUF2141 family)